MMALARTAQKGTAEKATVDTQPSSRRRAMAKSYIICNECGGVAEIFLTVDRYYVIDCNACGRHLQEVSESEPPDEPAPEPDLPQGEVNG
jgi:Domain found in IF2B/IF5